MTDAAEIVIVDDELSMRMHVKSMLKNLGYRINLLGAGKELIERLQQDKLPDLIILDVMMPEMDGYDVCRHIKTNPAWRHIPIVLVTVLEANEALLAGTNAGADDFVQKPVNKIELQARVRSMLRIKRQYDSLQKIMLLREDLSNMIVHDMSSPITSVLLHTTTLAQQINDTSQLEKLEQVQAAAEHLSTLVNNMLTMAKMEQSELILNRTLVNVSELLLESEKRLGIIAESKGIHLAFHLPDDSLECSLDSPLFSRVFDNLLTNALQYSPKDSNVSIDLTSAQATNKCLKLTVRDEGPGIPATDRKRIFDKFEVVELKKKGVRQVGLGLTFCKMVIEAHQGEISVSDNTPTGSVFTVTI